jgi:hypothetical protein
LLTVVVNVFASKWNFSMNGFNLILLFKMKSFTTVVLPPKEEDEEEEEVNSDILLTASEKVSGIDAMKSEITGWLTL